jgi:hypothetical protein
MLAVWLAVVLLLLPGIAVGQVGVSPERRPATERDRPTSIAPSLPEGVILETTPGGVPTEIAPNLEVSPQTPPAPTIRSGPPIVLPAPTPPGGRPRGWFELRPTFGISEEYSDNFRRSAENRESNFRTALNPGIQVLLDRGLLTGSALYKLSAFYDSLPQETGTHHAFNGLLAWQATPRLRLSLLEALRQNDDPEQADELQTTQQRREFLSNRTFLTSDYVLDTLQTKQYYHFSSFTRSGGQESKSQTHTFGLSATKILGAINHLTGGYEYLLNNSTTDQGAAAGTPITAESTITGHQVTGSFARDLSAVMTAGVSAAYAFRERESNSQTSSFSRWTFSVFDNYTLTDKLIVRASVGVGQLTTDGSAQDPVLITTTAASYVLGPATFAVKFSRGFSESFTESENFGVILTTSFSASVSYQFTPLLTGRILGTYRENESTGAGADVSNRNVKVYTARAGITYQIASWLTATLEAFHTDRTSGSQPSVNENRVHAVVNAIFY